MSELGTPGREGVYTVVPGTGKMGRRYGSRDAVPFTVRWRAQQIGKSGFWYVTDGFSSAAYRPTLSERAAVAIEDVNEATGADRGVLGIFSKLLGIPYPLSVILVLFLAYALLRGAGLVPPVRGVLK